MRLAFTLVLLPLAAQAGANPEALYRHLITGSWVKTGRACTDKTTWTFYEDGFNNSGDGGETCGFQLPATDGGVDVVLDVLCPIPGEELRAATRRVGLDLQSESPGLRAPGDRLTVIDESRTLILERCLRGSEIRPLPR